MSLSETLRRHPLLAAEWLQWRSRLRRVGQLAVAVVIASAALMLVLLRYATDVDGALTSMAGQWPIVFMLSTLFVMGHVTRRRRRLGAEAARSWLAAAPISQSDQRLALVVRVLLPIFALAAVACVLTLVVAHGAAAFDAAQRICSWLWIGVLVGSIAGWLPRQRPRSRFEASRYTPSLEAAATLAPSDRALSHWPIAQAFAWGRPENLRALIVVCLMLGVQAGTSALHGLLIVAAWLLAGYLGSLLAAVPNTAIAAARWLRSTPISRANFGWALARRALAHQAIGMLIAALAVSALGSPLRMTLTLGALWAAAIALAYTSGVWRSYR